MISFRFSFRLGLHPDGVFSGMFSKTSFSGTDGPGGTEHFLHALHPSVRGAEKNREKTVPDFKRPERQANIESLRKNFAFTCPILDIGFVRPEKFAKGGFSTKKTVKRKFDIKKRNRMKPKSSCETC